MINLELKQQGYALLHLAGLYGEKASAMIEKAEKEVSSLPYDLPSEDIFLTHLKLASELETWKRIQKEKLSGQIATLQTWNSEKQNQEAASKTRWIESRTRGREIEISYVPKTDQRRKLAMQ